MGVVRLPRCLSLLVCENIRFDDIHNIVALDYPATNLRAKAFPVESSLGVYCELLGGDGSARVVFRLVETSLGAFSLRSDSGVCGRFQFEEITFRPRNVIEQFTGRLSVEVPQRGLYQLEVWVDESMVASRPVVFEEEGRP